jgi:kynurenine formamidase
MIPYRIIDVTMWMDNYTFQNDQVFSVKGPFNRIIGDNPEYVYDLYLCTQTGTHIQGGHYFRKNGKRIEDYPLTAFEGKAFLIDILKRGEDITKSELIQRIGNINLQHKILILRTGHMDEVIRTGKMENAARPGLSLEAAVYLAKTKKIKMLAIDSVGVESRITKNYDVNWYLCGQDVLILEGLINLSAVSKQEVFLEAFPLKIRNVEGTPCRAIIREPIIL